MKRIHTLIAGAFFAVAGMTACQRSHDDTGWEFAPNMYNSVGYEPYTQIDKNPINADGKNMREPVPGTVSRRNYKTHFDSAGVDLMIYHIGKDDIATAEAVLKNPVPNNEKTLAEGKALYVRYCQHCHGEAGDGNGPVAEMYKGVPNYHAAASLPLHDGHLFHVIPQGNGRMWPHGSQVTPEERWKIAHYVHKLQKG